MLVPLFDLDWTLIQGGNKAHADSFAHAFRTVYGVEARAEEIETEGMTDRQIVAKILEFHNILLPQAHLQREMDQDMARYFLEHEEEGHYITLPGARESLEYFRKRKIPVGLLTGNIEWIAWRKCEKAGIRDLIDFGAFGNEAFKRSALVPIAGSRVPRFDPEQDELVIVGDSIRDIECANEASLRSVGVATGKHDAAELHCAGAHVTILTLEDLPKAFSFLEKIVWVPLEISL